jgi:predicted nucleic acid-binding protein
LKVTGSLVVAGSTIAEFWRNSRGLSEVRFGLLRATVVPIGSDLSRRAGELLAATAGRNTLDALVVAVAESVNANRILTTDVSDVEELVAAAGLLTCEVVDVPST